MNELNRIWAVELDLMEKFDSFCALYGLKYYIIFGTLLGAVRHGGFIPWDDDIDIMMPRPDYNRMLLIAPDHFSDPYKTVHYYDGEGVSPWGLTRFMNLDTTALETNPFFTDKPQGIFIDIFAFDDILGDEGQDPVVTKMLSELKIIIWAKEHLNIMRSSGYSFILPEDMISDLLRMSRITQIKVLEGMLSDSYGQTDHVAQSVYAMGDGRQSFDRKIFDDSEKLKFERLELPAPKLYRNFLESYFGGDYMTPKKGGSMHSIKLFDAFKSYTEYL